jgi:hypothetical protein
MEYGMAGPSENAVSNELLKEPNSALSKHEIEYLIEEMKAARQRIDEEIKTMNQFEILSITAIWVTYWAFLFFKITDYGALIVICFIPVLICVYGIFRYRAHADVVRIHERYIKLYIEKTIYSETNRPRGLVRYYDRKKRSLLKIARLSFWIAIFLISFGIFIAVVVAPEKITQIHSAAPTSRTIQ